MLVCVETRPLLATILESHHVVCEVSSPVQTVSIRSGITSGDVILMEGDDYIGHCVNVAARLCHLAQGGEALAAPSVMEALPRWGAVLEHKDITLRGVERPVPTAGQDVTRTPWQANGPCGSAWRWWHCRCGAAGSPGGAVSRRG
jgi:class 3 adenylate cyclase